MQKHRKAERSAGCAMPIVAANGIALSASHASLDCWMVKYTNTAPARLSSAKK